MKNRAFNFNLLKALVGVILFLGVCLCPSLAKASVGCTVLIYYNPGTADGGTGTDAVTNVIPVLQGMGANVVTIGVTSNTYDPTGDNWTVAGVPQYSQVWDMRFIAAGNPCPVGAAADTFSNVYNWQTVSTTYLEANGSLFINGENAGFIGRDYWLGQYLQAIGAVSGGYALCTANGVSDNGYDPLNVVPNNAPIPTSNGFNPPSFNFFGFAVGGVPLGLINGTNYVDNSGFTGGTDRSIATGWSGSLQMPSLTGGTVGKLFVVWDTSMWGAAYYVVPNISVTNSFFSSIYTWLGGTSCVPTPTPTNTATSTPTQTPTNTATNTPTNTPVDSFTPTNTPTVNTPTITNTPTSTSTSSPTPTATPNLYVWPNPFNPQTAINGVLQAGYVVSTATMSIYTITGELVISYCQNCPTTSIFYNNVTGTIDWRGRNAQNSLVSTGVYYYVIQSGGKTLLTGKLLVITGK